MTLSEEQVAALKKPISRDRVKKLTDGPSRGASYLEGYDVIDHANEIFGFDGWSLEVKSVEFVRADKSSVYRAIVGVHVGPTYREDIGIGISAGDSNQAQDTAMKGAVTDAMKRAFRTFGAQFGNSLYDKDGPEFAKEEVPMCEEHGVPFDVLNPKTKKRAHKQGEDWCVMGEAA